MERPLKSSGEPEMVFGRLSTFDPIPTPVTASLLSLAGSGSIARSNSESDPLIAPGSLCSLTWDLLMVLNAAASMEQSA
jgi:hypothetical protein